MRAVRRLLKLCRQVFRCVGGMVVLLYLLHVGCVRSILVSLVLLVWTPYSVVSIRRLAIILLLR